MIVDLALEGASPDDLAVLRRLLASDGLMDRNFVTTPKNADPGAIGGDIDMVQLALDSSSVGRAATALVLWLNSRTAEVEMRVETRGTFLSFKSEGLGRSPAVAAKLTEALQRAMRKYSEVL